MPEHPAPPDTAPVGLEFDLGLEVSAREAGIVGWAGSHGKSESELR